MKELKEILMDAVITALVIVLIIRSNCFRGDIWNWFDNQLIEK
jgi:hypothetical protein